MRRVLFILIVLATVVVANSEFASAAKFDKKNPRYTSCIVAPGDIASHAQVNFRVSNMGGYQSFLGRWVGALYAPVWEGSPIKVKVPVTIDITHHDDQFRLRMSWKAPGESWNSEEH